jgi:antitoxin (DNA-binding transcriptional repressor) of toxin-antitoxin stability system
MKTITLKDVGSSDEAIRQGQVEEVIVFRDGKPVALVIPFDDDDLEWYAAERDPAFIESIARAREQAKAGQTVSHEQLKARLGLK